MVAGLRGFAAALLLAAFAAPAAPAQDPATAAAAAPAGPTVEDYVALPFLSDPELSPDGRRIAARLVDPEGHRIGIWTLADGPGQRPRQINGGERVAVLSYRWAGPDRLLFDVLTFGRVAGFGVFPWPVRRVISHDISTGTTRILGRGGGMSDEVIFIDPHGLFVLLSTQDDMTTPPDVDRVDLATGARAQVQRRRSGVWNWFADNEGVVRVGVDYNERRTRIFYRPTAEADLRLIDHRRNQRDESVVEMIRFVTDTDRGVIVTNAETGRFAVYEYDFATDSRGAVLFEHPEVDVTRAIFGAEGSVDGVFFEDERPRTRWLRPELAELQRSVDSALPDKTNLILGRSRDGNRVLIWSSAGDDPGTYYVLDRAARRMEPFVTPYDRLQDHRFAPVRPVSYRSRDGLDIRGYLTLPPGREARALPLVVLPHGGPFLRDSWTFNPEVQFLAGLGYAVLQPNFRGSTGYGRDFVERGYGQLGGAMIDDIEDGVDWLVGEGIADRARVCIMGSSYGGYAAIWGAIRSPERYRCAISWAGPTDWRRMLRHDARFVVPERYIREWRRRVQGEERGDLDAVSPLRQAERLRVPLLVAHGERDARVPVAQSRDFLRALERRGIAAESVFYAEAGHDFTRTEDRADFLRRVAGFLERHNPAR